MSNSALVCINHKTAACIEILLLASLICQNLVLQTAEDALSGDANPKDKEKRSSDKANEIPAVVGSKSKEGVTKTVVPTKCTPSSGQNGLTAANMKDFNIEVVYLEPVVPETVWEIAKTPSLTSEKSQKSLPINKGSSKNSEPKPDSVEEVSQSPRAVMPQIARIKEQLFAKIKTPLNDKARQSERLGNKGISYFFGFICFQHMI